MIKRSNVKTFRFNETIDFPPREKEKKKIPLRLRLNHGYHRTRKTVGLGWVGGGIRLRIDFVLRVLLHRGEWTISRITRNSFHLVH